MLANQIGKPDASPVYSVLKRHPDAIDTLVQDGKVAEAERYLELLREFEGDASPVVEAVEARLRG